MSTESEGKRGEEGRLSLRQQRKGRDVKYAQSIQEVRDIIQTISVTERTPISTLLLVDFTGYSSDYVDPFGKRAQIPGQNEAPTRLAMFRALAQAILETAPLNTSAICMIHLNHATPQEERELLQFPHCWMIEHEKEGGGRILPLQRSNSIATLVTRFSSESDEGLATMETKSDFPQPSTTQIKHPMHENLCAIYLGPDIDSFLQAFQNRGIIPGLSSWYVEGISLYVPFINFSRNPE